MIWLLMLLMALVQAATPGAPAVRLDPPRPAIFDSLNVWPESCTRSMIGDAEVTASHCLNGGYRDGFLFDGDVATTAAVDWVDVGSVPVGSTVWAIGYPFSLRPDRVEYTLSALHTQVVEVYGVPQLVLMTKGSGTPCLSGASGMIAWASVDGLLQPIGPLSVGSIDPQVTGLPAGQFVCGFAIPMKGTS